MSRPKIFKERRISTAIRLPETLHETLKKAAAGRDVSVNFLVTRAIGEYLDRLIPADEVRLTRPSYVQCRKDFDHMTHDCEAGWVELRGDV